MKIVINNTFHGMYIDGWDDEALRLRPRALAKGSTSLIITGSAMQPELHGLHCHGLPGFAPMSAAQPRAKCHSVPSRLSVPNFTSMPEPST